MTVAQRTKRDSALFHLAAVRDGLKRMNEAHRDKKRADDFQAAHYAAAAHLADLERMFQEK